MNITAKKETLDFMFYTYFGVTPNEVENASVSPDNLKSIAIKCAKRAYLDFNRTLTFKKDNTEEERTRFNDEMCNLIVGCIYSAIFKSTPDDFDVFHSRLCSQICVAANEQNVLENMKVTGKDAKMGVNFSTGFQYGQAQKWLNMTIKYMWLMGLWDDKLAPLKDVLHVPVDSYVLEAIWHENLEGNVNKYTKFKVALPCYDDNSRYKSYSNDRLVSWSRWNNKIYEDFQTTLRAYIKDCTDYDSALDWEGPEWIKVAQIRNNK